MSKKTGTAKPRTGLVAALDLGTTKVTCLIAKLTPGAAVPENRIEIVGHGHYRSGGVRGGAVVDLDSAESVIRTAVEAAEREVGENIERLFVNLSAGKPHSKLIAYDIDISGREITDHDMARLMDPDVLARETPEGQEIIHGLPVGYSVDDDRGIRDPRGLYGEKLGVNLHLVSAQRAPMKNLKTVIERCHLKVETPVVTPYASALACLVNDERELGTTCIDLGGGTTSIAIYFDGELVHTDVIPVGGSHLTNDIARGLSTPSEEAERMKTLYGCVIPSPSDDQELITVPLIGEDSAHHTAQVPRSVLIGIVRPRAEEILELVRTRLIDNGFEQMLGQRVVLTGGASALAGLPELAARMLGRQVRVASPRPVKGLTKHVLSPCHATAVGLIHYAAQTPIEVMSATHRPQPSASGPFGKLGQWFRENF